MSEDGITISRRTLRRVGLILSAAILVGAGFGVARLTSSDGSGEPKLAVSPSETVTTTAVTAPPTTPAAATTAAPSTTTTVVQTYPFLSFSGTWGRHGFGINMTAQGEGSASWRIYSWCGQSPPPCDSMQGNNIISGGQGTIVLTTASAGVARGNVTYSTDGTTLPVGPIMLNLAAGDELLVTPRVGQTITLCGPHADPSCYGA